MVPEEPFFLSLVLANGLNDQVILVRNAYFFVKFRFHSTKQSVFEKQETGYSPAIGINAQVC